MFPVANRDCQLILGIDPARKNDNIAMVWRRGQNVERIVCFAPPKSTDKQTADDLIWKRVTREIRACYPDEIIPNNNDFVKELRMIKYNPNSPKFRLVEKDEIKKSLKHSPDIADAFALTFPYEERYSVVFRVDTLRGDYGVGR